MCLSWGLGDAWDPFLTRQTLGLPVYSGIGGEECGGAEHLYPSETLYLSEVVGTHDHIMAQKLNYTSITYW